MLTQLYAHEFPSTHLTALAPGLVDTAMQAFISDPSNIDIHTFPSFGRLRDQRASGAMPSAAAAAHHILAALPGFRGFDSGSFIDIRNLPSN